MAWNRPQSNSPANESLRRMGTVRPSTRCAIAGAIIILCACIAACLFWPDSKHNESTASAAKRSHIKEVTPAKATTNAVAAKVKKDDKPRALNGCPLDQCYKDAQGVLRMPGGARVLTKPPRRVVKIGEGKPKVFQNRSEKIIASVLELEPGELIVGTLNLDARFTEDFKKALKSPTLVTAEDSLETAQLKRDVHEAMAELKARMDAGEDPGKILSDTREEYQRLGVYRNQLEDEISKMRRDSNLSDDDYEDAVKAANILLEKKGAKPISMPRSFFKHAFKVRSRINSEKK